MCKLILTAGLCLIIASLARTTSAICISSSTNGCALGFCYGKADGNYVNTANPNTFYMCSNQLTYLMTCQSGLIFKACSNRCDYPNSQCPTKTTKGPINTPDTFCQGKANGLYCYTPDATKFYQCSNGYTFIMSCPPTTVFSITASVCVYPGNVQ